MLLLKVHCWGINAKTWMLGISALFCSQDNQSILFETLSSDSFFLEPLNYSKDHFYMVLPQTDFIYPFHHAKLQVLIMKLSVNADPYL